MDKKKTLSLFSILALLVAIPIITGYLQKSGFEFRISALEEDEPRNVIVSDVKDVYFKVTWITERQVIGGVLLADGTQLMENEKSSYHSVTMTGLNSSTTYSFKLISGSKQFGREEGGDYTVDAASTSITEDKFLIYGQVFSADGFSFQQEGIVTLELSSSTLESQIISTIINETGGYQFDLGGLLSKSLDRNYPYKEQANARLKVYISHDQQGVDKQFAVDLSTNRQMPNIYLGEVNIDIIPAIDGS